MVVVAILALLMGILLPALASSRTEGTKIKCLANLHVVGQAFAAYSIDDERSFTSPIHPKAEQTWWYDGEYEYGGKTGVGIYAHQDFVQENRILNRYLVGANGGSICGLFECPSDQGVPDAPYDFDDYFLGPLLRGRATHIATGTSYRLNNHIDFTSNLDPQFGTHFYGPYMRPTSQVPDPGTTVLLEEAIAEVAKWNEMSYRTLGWHRKMNVFNVLFADAHAGAIQLQGQPPVEARYADYWVFRGEGWRMDCYPLQPICDKPRRCDP